MNYNLGPKLLFSLSVIILFNVLSIYCYFNCFYTYYIPFNMVKRRESSSANLVRKFTGDKTIEFESLFTSLSSLILNYVINVIPKDSCRKDLPFTLEYFLILQTYFNADLLTLVRNMITGSVSNQLDEMLAEGKNPHGSHETNDIAAVRNRCRIGQVSLYGGALAEFGVSILVLVCPIKFLYEVA